MAYEVFANTVTSSNAPTSTLAAAITTVGQTTCVVTSAASFSPTGNFRIRIDLEIMIVTAVSGTTFTITRGAEGTAAATHANGSDVNQLLTAGAVQQVQQDRPQFTNTSNFVYTIDSTNGGLPDVIVWHNRAGNTAYVLPVPTQGRHLELPDITGAIHLSANWVSIVPNAGETINGSAGFALSGTAYHFTNGSASVTATGSKFTTELYVGASIASSNQAGVNYIVLSITNDTSLTLNSNFTGTTTTTATATRTSLQFSADFGKLNIDSDGTNWRIKGDGTPTVLSFTTVGAFTFIPPAGTTGGDIEMCGGGGGGGSGACGTPGGSGGGGGAGAGGSPLLRFHDTWTGNTSISGTVGDGGNGGAAVNATNTLGNNGAGGQASVFHGVSALGGSGGGGGAVPGGTTPTANGGVPYTLTALANNTTTTSNTYATNSINYFRGSFSGQAQNTVGGTALAATLTTGPTNALPGNGGDGGEGNQTPAVAGIGGNVSSTGQAAGTGGAAGTTNTNVGGSGGGGGGGGAFGVGANGGAGANGTPLGTGTTATTPAAAGNNTGAGGAGGGACGNGATLPGTSAAGSKGGSGKVNVIYTL